MIHFKSIVFLLLMAHSYTCVSQEYEDGATQFGISVMNQNSDNWGSGMSFFDFNQDGWDDLMYTREGQSIKCYINESGILQEIDLNLPDFQMIKQAIWVDFDNDGDMDLMASTYLGKYQLFENDGNLNFTDISEDAGLLQNVHAHYGVTFGDYNRDGYLDLYVANYNAGFDANELVNNNQLYRNNGNGTFTNVTFEAGVGDGSNPSFMAGWIDYNNDSWPDIYVINDRASYENSLYRNNGDGTFTDVTEEAGAAYSSRDPMTLSVSDFDNDSDLDIFLSNTGPTLHTELLLNNGDDTFTEAAADYGLLQHIFSWGAVWVDVENDGRQDLFLGTSPIQSQELNPDIFFHQNEFGFFETNETVLQGVTEGRTYAVARGDINNNGFYDIATHSIAPENAKLWVNSGGSNNYLKVTLQGTLSNRMAVGSWIRVYADNQTYYKYTMCGENYVSQNTQHHIFGLGQVDMVDSVQVEYTSGHIDTYYDLPVDSGYFFTEGETFKPAVEASGSLSFCEGDSVILNAEENESYLWNSGDTSQTITVFEPGSYFLEAQNEFGIVGWSDTLHVEVNSLPFIDVITENPTCSESQDGSISLVNQTGVSAAEVIWDETSGTVFHDSLDGGTYNYLFIDINGCTAQGSALITAPQPLIALFFTSPEIVGEDGEINIFVSGGTPPYTVFLNGEQALLNNDNMSAGEYVVEIFDDNDCLFTSLVEVETLTHVTEITGDEISVFPNPLQYEDELKLFSNVNSTNATIRVSDLSGKVIFQYSAGSLNPGVNEIPLKNIRQGTYLLQVLSDDRVLFTTNLIKL